MTSVPVVAVAPGSQPQYLAAVALGGGVAADLNASTTGLVWTDSQAVSPLQEILQQNPQLEWLQLPFAGVDNFKPVFESIVARDSKLVVTSAKGAYREPVAEHALMLALALARVLPERISANAWGRKYADTLFDANIVIVGGGGIAEELVRLLTPFRAKISVVRRTPQQMTGVEQVVELGQLNNFLPEADFIFLACALTAETEGLFDKSRFEHMKPTSRLVNIARGAVVNSFDLETALRSGEIAGAGIDVTDPEPLPTGHSLWDAPNLIITPHTADTPEMCVRLLSARITKNVGNLINNQPLEGQVNLKLGY